MQLTDELYTQFRALITGVAGLDFGPTKHDLLLGKLRERAQAANCPDLVAYYQLITSTAVEQRETERRQLFQALTITETCFFRNQEHFAALREVALPEVIARLVQESGTHRLRVWSAGCATGEEPYSLAIALRESLAALTETGGWRTEVYATDINEAALRKAQQGHYGKRAMREVAADIRARYFTTEPLDSDDPRTFIINQEIQQHVTFEWFNLAAFPYDTRKLGNCDIIFCENVMIYFAPPVIRQVIDNLYRCLRPGGYLFLGYAETLWHIPNHFQVVSLPNTFCYRRPLPDEATISPQPLMVRKGSGSLRLPNSAPLEAPPTPIARRQSAAPMFPARRRQTGPLPTPPAALPLPPAEEEHSASEWCAVANDLIVVGDYDAATSAYQAALRQNPQQVEAICGLARIHANRGLHDLAISECLRAVATDALYSEAHILMGVIYAQEEGQTARLKAIEAFRKAIYVDPASVAAHFHLGELYRNLSVKAAHRREQQAAMSAARHEYETTQKLLQKLPAGAEVEGLPASTLLRVCELNIAALQLS